MQADVLIIGCGLGGAAAALRLSDDHERQITVLTRASDAAESNSSWAQGGIVGLGHDDTSDLLVQDVVAAGDGLSLPEAVRLLADEGPRLLREILVDAYAVHFDRDASGKTAFGLEAAHSRRRILHVRDATGEAIMERLLGALAARPNVRLLTGWTAVDLLTFPHHSRDNLAVYHQPRCHGAYALERDSGRVEAIVAGRTILATGGIGQIFLNTTNPHGARGDGIAMAYRAGARVVNAEYVQFHPTALHMPGTTKTLITEAVRGEGGVLLTPEGEPFMQRYAPGGRELATRDVVARAIYSEMLANDHPFMLLDIASQMPAERIRERFPSIHRLCLDRGIDMTERPIPVVPAAHYFCGGVLVDLQGRTTLEGLHAVGEVSCTGVHGANRLASTSLLEALVWGDRAARDIRNAGAAEIPDEPGVPAWDTSGSSYEADPALISVDMQTIRTLMWHYVGLLRTSWRLERAIRELARLRTNIEDFYRKAYLTDELVGLRNAVLNAQVVTHAAFANPTSRGCHHREDDGPLGGARPPDEGRI